MPKRANHAYLLRERDLLTYHVNPNMMNGDHGASAAVLSDSFIISRVPPMFFHTKTAKPSPAPEQEPR